MASPGWAALQGRYRLHLQALGRTPETIALHLRALRQWAAVCAEHGADPLNPTAADAERWLACLYRSYARNTVCSKFVSVRFFFKCQGNAAAFLALPAPKQQHAPIRPYPHAELQQLLALATARERAIILLLFGSGLRASELVAVRFTDIDWPAGRIRVIGKGGKPRTVCPGNRAMMALRLYADGSSGDYIFPSRAGHIARTTLWLIIDRLAKRAGVDGGVHRFRHSFAGDFLDNGGNPADLQIILGHSTIAMSLRYAAYGSVDRALDAQRRFNPADRLTRVV